MPKKIKQASSQPEAPREKHFEFPSSHTLAVDPKNVKHLYRINEQQKLCRKRDNMLVLTTIREKNQGHPTTIFGKYLFGRRFEVYNFRNIFAKNFLPVCLS